MNAMEGAALAAKRQSDRDIALAWHTAVFALQGYSGKLKGKSLADYLSDGAKPSRRSTAADAIAFFHSLRARGVPVKITRH